MNTRAIAKSCSIVISFAQSIVYVLSRVKYKPNQSSILFEKQLSSTIRNHAGELFLVKIPKPSEKNNKDGISKSA
jgi:hypothetical protein